MGKILICLKEYTIQPSFFSSQYYQLRLQECKQQSDGNKILIAGNGKKKVLFRLKIIKDPLNIYIRGLLKKKMSCNPGMFCLQ